MTTFNADLVQRFAELQKQRVQPFELHCQRLGEFDSEINEVCASWQQCTELSQQSNEQHKSEQLDLQRTMTDATGALVSQHRYTGDDHEQWPKPDDDDLPQSIPAPPNDDALAEEFEFSAPITVDHILEHLRAQTADEPPQHQQQLDLDDRAVLSRAMSDTIDAISLGPLPLDDGFPTIPQQQQQQSRYYDQSRSAPVTEHSRIEQPHHRDISPVRPTPSKPSISAAAASSPSLHAQTSHDLSAPELRIPQLASPATPMRANEPTTSLKRLQLPRPSSSAMSPNP